MFLMTADFEICVLCRYIFGIWTIAYFCGMDSKYDFDRTDVK